LPLSLKPNTPLVSEGRGSACHLKNRIPKMPWDNQDPGTFSHKLFVKRKITRLSDAGKPSTKHPRSTGSRRLAIGPTARTLFDPGEG
jgi:hypothetical protein